MVDLCILLGGLFFLFPIFQINEYLKFGEEGSLHAPVDDAFEDIIACKFQLSK